MRRSRILIFLTTLCLSTQLVLAQDRSDLASNIDRNAAAVGLPSGDGANSPAEVYLASLMRQEMDDFSNKVDTFEQSSPQNSELINQVEDTTGQYNELAHVSHDEAMAQTLGEVSKNLEALINKLEAEAANNPAAQEIADGVADADAGDPLTPEESSAYAKEISDAFNQYNRENAQALGKDTLAPTEQNFMVQSVINAINDYLNDSNVKRKEIVKRRMKRLIEIMVPSQNLPINGYWRPLPYSVSTTGSCIATNGDNDGPGSSGANNENPGNPLCGYAIAGAPPFITWTDGSHPYLPGSSSMYGRAPQESFGPINNSSGQSIGSVKITTMTEYEVISPTQIRVHVFRQEAGGCTQNSTYMLELVTPDDSVCNVPAAAATPEPVSTPVPTIPKSTYIIREPSLSEPAQCDATNTPPQADEISVEQASDYSVTIEFGGVTRTLFPYDYDSFDYNSGRDNNLRESISLSISDDRTSGYLSWSINNIDTGNLCYYSSNIALPGSAAAEEPADEPAEAGGNTGSSSGGDESASFTLEAGDFNVSLSEMVGLTCPEALRPQIPPFENASLSGSGTEFTLESDGVEYPLMQLAEQYMYTTINPDNSVVYMGIFSRENDGSMYGMYSYSLENGTSCIFEMEFAPAG
ncbi:MAG: hypothetical protein LCI00_33315 [Chloroflexi bacterium]|nr:hypothetical protein [Chloroflexota bacterium]MCC6897104.1 hypothetical protein [Anaerolineae bacterium]